MTSTSDDLGAIGLKNFNEFSPQLPTNREHRTTRDLAQRRDTFPPVKQIPSASLLISDSIELNVGGIIYVTSGWILAREHTSWLATSLDTTALLDRRGRYFIDRDGDLFRFVLDYLRSGLIQIPKDFPDLELLRNEATFYGLKIMKRLLDHIQQSEDFNDPRKGNYVTLTEHATFNVKCRENVKVVFKRVSSITVAGYVKSCRKIFGNKLSLDRDSNDTQDRYSCRMVIVQGKEATVFDTLEENGYELVSDNKTDGTAISGARNRPDYIHEENMRWIHVTNYYFRRKDISE